MRLAIDTQSTLGHKTGIGQYTAHLLAALRRIAPEHEYVELNWGGDVVMRLDRRLRWQQWDVPRRAKRMRADVLHVPGFDAPLWRPCPTVLTVHDLIGMIFPANLPPASRFYWSKWLPFAARFAHRIIADSDATRRDILRLLRVPPERVTVIQLGVDPRFQPQAQPAIEACRARHTLPARFILYLGTLEPRKGIDTLIDAFASLAHAHPHDLVLAGKRGWYWEPLFDRMRKLGLADRVHVIDYVADDDLPSLYSAAAVFAFPSRYEGFGLPVLEAMACSAPVVCSNASSLPEVIGDAAISIRPDDTDGLARALESVLGDDRLRNDLREKGLQQAQRFTWEKTAQATLAVYRALIDLSAH